MLLHEFRPGRLIVGATGLAVAALFAGDAAGAWQTPWYTVIPLFSGGLLLASVATWTAYAIRRRRSARAASRENTGAPASTNGNQAMR